jgi:hypothetical protein
MDWYRAYHGMPQDTKLKVIAHRTKQPMASVLSVWVCLLDMASQNNPRGNVVIDAEQIAVLQNLETEDVTKIINAFYEKNLLTPESRITNWDKRQYTTPTERSKKSRAKVQQGETPRNAAQRDATPGNMAQRKNGKKTPDTDYRVQNADTEGRNAEARVADAEEEAEADKEKKSDKKLQTHTEKEEREKEKQKIGGQATDQTHSENHSHNQIVEQMLDIWNEEVQSKLTPGQKAILTPKRKAQMAERWLGDFQQDMRAWRYYCEIIGASNFCLGKREGKEGKAWTIDLSWAIASSDNVARIMEGGFSGGNHPPRSAACNVMVLQKAWDSVLQSFERKYGKATCRSWLAGTVVTNIKQHPGGTSVTLQCPSKFSREWLTQHYLADLTRWFAEATKTGARVTAITLTVEERNGRA